MIYRRPNGYYYADFYHGEQEHRRRIRASLKTKDKGLALDRLHALQERLSAADAGRDRPTLREFAERYFAWAWVEKPAGAAQESRRWLHVRDLWEREYSIKRLDEVQPHHIEAAKAYVRSGMKRKRSKATVNLYLCMIRSIFKCAVNWGALPPPGPHANIRMFRPPKVVRGITPAQEERVFAVLDEIRAHPDPRSKVERIYPDMATFIRNTGLRRGEVMGARWRDVRGDLTELKVHGKGDKERVIPLNRTARDTLRRLPRGGERIFDYGRANVATMFTNVTEKIKHKARAPNYNLHALRHAFVSELVRSGVDLATVRELVGHSHISMTSIYAHSTEGDKRAAVSILDKHEKK